MPQKLRIALNDRHDLLVDVFAAGPRTHLFNTPTFFHLHAGNGSRGHYFQLADRGGASRAGHAHKALHQMLIAMSGSFDVVLDDGRESRTFHLNRSYYGLYIPPMVWREINNFSSGAVCMALASDFYDEADYYREHDTFVTAVTSP